MNHTDSLAGHALSSRSKPKNAKATKKVRKMHITKAHGGYHIVHEHDDPIAHPAEEHVAPDMAALHEHMEEHMGEPNPGEQAQGAPAPEDEGAQA
jgi:hypothetical protein